MLTTIIVGLAVCGLVVLAIGVLADQAGEPGGLLIAAGLLCWLADLLILAALGGVHLGWWG